MRVSEESAGRKLEKVIEVGGNFTVMNCDLYSSLNIIRAIEIKEYEVGGAYSKHGREISEYKKFVGEPEGKRPV
jgi:hypothetical protein